MKREERLKDEERSSLHESTLVFMPQFTCCVAHLSSSLPFNAIAFALKKKKSFYAAYHLVKNTDFPFFGINDIRLLLQKHQNQTCHGKIYLPKTPLVFKNIR